MGKKATYGMYIEVMVSRWWRLLKVDFRCFAHFSIKFFILKFRQIHASISNKYVEIGFGQAIIVQPFRIN